MFLHLAVPGFHAAVHQSAQPGLRGRPVAVAVDAGDQAPLFALSREARAQGLRPGMRAAAARRQCRGLAVVTPEPEWYRRAQRALAGLCAAYTPCVGGRAGRLDADLAGTERLWGQRLAPSAGATADAPLVQAALIARGLRAQAAERVGLDACLGVGHRLITARLGARLARDRQDDQVVVVDPAHAEAWLDNLPLAWIPDCAAELLRLFADCGLATIADARALGAERLRELAGDEAAPIIAALGDGDEPVVPHLADPEPAIAVGCRCGESGADPQRTALLVAGLARDLGFALRERHLACATLVLSGRHLDGRQVHDAHHAERQVRHDDDIARLAMDLVGRRSRRVHWERLTLSATGLCAAEEQLELFAPQRVHRLEHARDALRRRFGAELVGPLSQAG